MSKYVIRQVPLAAFTGRNLSDRAGSRILVDVRRVKNDQIKARYMGATDSPTSYDNFERPRQIVFNSYREASNFRDALNELDCKHYATVAMPHRSMLTKKLPANIMPMMRKVAKAQGVLI